MLLVNKEDSVEKVLKKYTQKTELKVPSFYKCKSL